MILISHRGNLNGAIEKRENSPKYIDEAIQKGFNVEIDVWYKNCTFYLGHDKPSYVVDENYITNKKFWCHAKNIEAMEALKKINTNFFWHQNDDVVLTSNGYFWTYPGKKLLKNSICVLPEISNLKNFNSSGICSDFIESYKIYN
jgi:hypothetical protein